MSHNPQYTPTYAPWIEAAKQAIAECEYPGYKFHVQVDGRGEVFLQATYYEPDTISGDPDLQHTRRWFLSPAMSKSEIVQTAFKCIITSMEHRAREWFTWNNRAIFHPHHNIEKLWEICEERVTRDQHSSPSTKGTESRRGVAGHLEGIPQHS